MEPKKLIPGTTSFAIELREIREKAEAARHLGRIEDLQAALERETRLLRRAYEGRRPPLGGLLNAAPANPLEGTFEPPTC
ncbi:hypothetical protein [Bosea beijingensis]